MIILIASCNDWPDVSYLANTPASIQHLNGSGLKPCSPVLLTGDKQDFINWFSSFDDSTLKRFTLSLLSSTDSDKLMVTALWRKLSREERIEFINEA